MSDQPVRKPFTAELMRLRKGSGDPSIQPSSREVMDAIHDLKADIKMVELMLRSGKAPEPSPEDRAKVAQERNSLENEKAEIEILRTEVRALARSIHQTKTEIAALRSQDSDDDHLIIVSNELDAVVNATEGATQAILEAAEKIDSLAENVKAKGSQDSYLYHISEEISDNVVAIFEACNFQDITGQRITKVVNTLKFIEERVNAMVEIWGSESFEGNSPASTKAKPSTPSDDSHLLNGPQLENRGISQDDIDKLFG
jgi:chemotaxis protein CheZ